MIPCIDLFSGIGGISLALKDFVQPLLYCELNPFCQNVLIKNMQEGYLHKAPIHNDIQNLYVSPALKPLLICGGFPCTDVSSIGLQKGIVNGKESSLFYHIMRIVDECDSVQMIFLENVHNILKCGIHEIIAELVKRNFNLQWIIRSAGEFGAPHVRERWFCLAYKKGFNINSCIPLNSLKYDFKSKWLDEPKKRTIAKSDADAHWIQRSQALGNTVVPHVVYNAFIELIKASLKWNKISKTLKEYAITIDNVKDYSENALIYNSKYYVLPKKVLSCMTHNIFIELTNNVKLKNFPTPRRGISHPSVLTERSIKDLPTVLVHSADGLETSVPNITYIEWMMGYKKDWTKVNIQKEIKASNNNLNGYHVFLKENNTKPVKELAKKWRLLTPEEKNNYSQKAKNLNNLYKDFLC